MDTDIDTIAINGTIYSHSADTMVYIHRGKTPKPDSCTYFISKKQKNEKNENEILTREIELMVPNSQPFPENGCEALIDANMNWWYYAHIGENLCLFDTDLVLVKMEKIEEKSIIVASRNLKMLAVYNEDIGKLDVYEAGHLEVFTSIEIEKSDNFKLKSTLLEIYPFALFSSKKIVLIKENKLDGFMEAI